MSVAQLDPAAKQGALSRGQGEELFRKWKGGEYGGASIAYGIALVDAKMKRQLCAVHAKNVDNFGGRQLRGSLGREDEPKQGAISGGKAETFRVKWKSGEYGDASLPDDIAKHAKTHAGGR